ncbi:hypothetical protein RHDC4_01422 [Rhodocyclaceae bacterium]|nr:hypothetical protein RHDC4_01422 [Rhodocyclaceae bacterium]
MATRNEKIGSKVAQMMAGADGVTVFQEGKDFGVGFTFSNTMVGKMKGVPGAEFDREGGHWRVPASSVEALMGAVEDMRDFSRNGGVQVKDLAGGAKLVIFDYNKAVSQIIGPVAGAEFKKDVGGWVVPGDSKALVAEQGQSSYFDLAINKMRGMVTEISQAHESIKNLAAEHAKGKNLKPGIHYPETDQSYTGPIINANGHYAAQLTGIEDQKGVMFLTIHEQAALGKEVLKGDDLRIDYRPDRSVQVRTTEVFRQQQAERQKLEQVAAEKMDGAKVFNASTKDNKHYVGDVVEMTDHFVLQKSNRDGFTIHDRSKLKGNVVKGENLDVKYENGVGKVHEKAKGKELAGAER